MSELAPWESGQVPAVPDQKKAQPAAASALKPVNLDKLPEVYRPDGDDFIGLAESVPQPGNPPRQPMQKAMMALVGLGVGGVLGIVVTVLAYLVFPPEFGAFRTVVAALGVLFFLACEGVVLSELPRLAAYRTKTFFPGVLIYGSHAQIEKVAGPGGMPAILSNPVRGTGSGILNKVFDRSAHIASPPEVVALHCDRGSGPELVGIAWEAVHELKRGDIVWFHVLGPDRMLMFHKLIPFAPRTQADPATRNEVFGVLQVGKSLYREAAQRQAMGQTKVLNTDADGKIIAQGQDDRASQPNLSGDTEQVPRLGDPGGPLGGYEYQSDEDDQ